MKKIKILLALLFVGGFVFFFTGCGKDENGNDAFQMASVTVTKNGTPATYGFTVAAASSKQGAGDTAYTVIAASNITSQIPSMTVIVQGKSAGTFNVSLSSEAILGFDLTKILTNTVIVYLSSEEYVIMTIGTITISSVADNIIQGSFSGRGANGNDLKNMDLDALVTFLLAPPYTLEGSFTTAKVNF